MFAALQGLRRVLLMMMSQTEAEGGHEACEWHGLVERPAVRQALGLQICAALGSNRTSASNMIRPERATVCGEAGDAHADVRVHREDLALVCAQLRVRALFWLSNANKIRNAHLDGDKDSVCGVLDPDCRRALRNRKWQREQQDDSPA